MDRPDDGKIHDQTTPSEFISDLQANSVPWDVYIAEFTRTYGNPYEAWVEWRRRQELPAVRDHRAHWAAIARQQVATDREEKIFAVSLLYDDDGFPLVNEATGFPAKRSNPETIRVLGELGITPERAATWSRQTLKGLLIRLWRMKWHKTIDESSAVPPELRAAAKSKADEIIDAAFKERRRFRRKPCRKTDCSCSICKSKRRA